MTDVLKISPCHQHDCPRIVEEWINNGSCECTGPGEGNQTQIQLCHDGTTEKCSEIQTKRVLSCREAGTLNQDCGGKTIEIVTKIG